MEGRQDALQSLWRTKDIGITYGGETGGTTKLSAWINADHGTYSDSRRSVGQSSDEPLTGFPESSRQQR